MAKDHATVVCLDIEGAGRRLVGCFGVSFEETEKPNLQMLAGRIAALCAERQFKFSEAAVALDCAMFMQHSVHSEFADFKKITQTVRFDTEEALGTDATDVAIAFKVDSSDKTGSNLSVFTATKQLLGELLSALQSNNIDPVSVEPDVSCLARFLCQNVSLPADASPLFAFLSRRNGYFLTPLSTPWQAVLPTPPVAVRTFLLSAQNRTELLARQVAMTVALLHLASPVNRLDVFDAADSVRCDDIAKKLTIQTERVDIGTSAGLSAENLADCPDLVGFAIAYGAAIVYLDLPRIANWRSDFMPYQGRKLRLQKTMKFLGAAAVVLMLAVGLYGLMQAIQVNKYRVRLREKFTKEYSAVMFGQQMPDKSKEAVRKLSAALRRIKDAQKGFSITGEDAIAGKLAMVLQAFNKCAAATGLNIDSVAISDKSITISGATSGPDNTLKVFDALKQTGLNVLQQRISSEGGRSTFSVVVEPKK
ncbi:MAG: hypothetical protein ABSG82_01060 [Sedimentisphaerales bacterium]